MPELTESPMAEVRVAIDKIDELKPLPGVYVAHDSAGNVLYVGMSGNILQRSWTHRSQAPWWASCSEISVIYTETRNDAVDLEKHLIHALNPIHNSRRQWYGHPDMCPCSSEVCIEKRRVYWQRILSKVERLASASPSLPPTAGKRLEGALDAAWYSTVGRMVG